MIRTDDELDELKRSNIQLIDIIENAEEFPTNPSGLCDWCEFKSIIVDSGFISTR